MLHGRKKKHHPARGNFVFAFNTCREKVMRRKIHGEREEERERGGGRETLLGDRAYILNFNKIRGEERVSVRDREVAVSNM